MHKNAGEESRNGPWNTTKPKSGSQNIRIVSQKVSTKTKNAYEILQKEAPKNPRKQS